MPGPLKQILPITPAQAAQARVTYLPRFVAKAFNELLRANVQNGVARFSQDEAVSSIIEHAAADGEQLTRADVFSRKLMDIEEHYAKYGWLVTYHSQDRGDSTPASFVFKADPSFSEP